jgi:hypothetical protein
VTLMANTEHLAKLKEGVYEWNTWRASHPAITPDLTGADLGQAILGSFDFTWADLSEANLSGANLYGANLERARLTSASLTHADLEKSNLSRAHFRWGTLKDANLRDAWLTWAELQFVNVESVDLSGAHVGSTIFADVDLSASKGIDRVRHVLPSTIGLDTIYRSKGKIPEVFLRGCGVPEDFIAYAKSLVNNPIEFYSCFISYSSNDSDFATELHTKLQASNVRCWYAPEDLKIGDPFQERIEESIRLHDKLLVVLSENSVNSPWVEREVNAAFDREFKQKRKDALFPIRLDDNVLESDKPWAADLRRTRHIGDFRNWKDHDSFKKAFDRLLRDLKSSDSQTKTS